MTFLIKSFHQLIYATHVPYFLGLVFSIQFKVTLPLYSSTDNT